MGLGMRCITDEDSQEIVGIPTEFIPQKCGSGLVCDRISPDQTYGKCLKKVGVPCNSVSECSFSSITCAGVCADVIGGINQTCVTSTNTGCSANLTCIAGKCKFNANEVCEFNSDCASNWCDSGICKTRLENGSPCASNDFCQSAYCDFTALIGGSFCQDQNVTTGTFGATCALDLDAPSTAKCYPDEVDTGIFVELSCVPIPGSGSIYGTCADLSVFWPENAFNVDERCSTSLSCIPPTICYNTGSGGNFCVLPRDANNFLNNTCGAGTTGLCIPGYTCNGVNCIPGPGLPSSGGLNNSICTWQGKLTTGGRTYIGRWNNNYTDTVVDLESKEFSAIEYLYNSSTRRLFMLTEYSDISSIPMTYVDTNLGTTRTFTTSTQIIMYDVYGSIKFKPNFAINIQIDNNQFLQVIGPPSTPPTTFEWVTNLSIRNAKFIPSGNILLQLEAEIQFIGGSNGVTTGYVNFIYLVEATSIINASSQIVMQNPPDGTDISLLIDDMFDFTSPTIFDEIEYTQNSNTYKFFNYPEFYIFNSPTNFEGRFEYDGRAVDNSDLPNSLTGVLFTKILPTINVLLILDGTRTGVNGMVKDNPINYSLEKSVSSSIKNIIPFISSKSIDSANFDSFTTFTGTSSYQKPNPISIFPISITSAIIIYSFNGNPIPQILDYNGKNFYYPPADQQGDQINNIPPVVVRYAVSGALGTTPSQLNFVYLARLQTDSSYYVRIVSSRSDRMLPGYFNDKTLVCYPYRYLNPILTEYQIPELGWTPTPTIFTSTD